jgi:hypothetical protein
MPVCANCLLTFPNRIKVGGRPRNISNRKYCLGCSPFGLHNTRTVSRIRRRDIVVCLRCSRNYEYDKSKGHTQSLCNSCNANRKRTTVKLRALTYKGGKCQKCGYSKCKRALSFHHLKEAEKSFGIGGKLSRTWAELQKELDKCILLCANCHMESHCKECSALPI